MLSHEATQLFAVHHYALLTQRCTNAAVSVAFELIADRADPGDQLVRSHGNRRTIIEGRA